MAVVAFDLDETLGRFSTPSIHLLFLDLAMYYDRQGKGYEPFKPSSDLQNKMDAALTHFAKCMATNEEGLQLLRPGILQIVKKVSDAKDAGLIKHIVVYSNNGNLNCLKLATRMIEFLLNKPNIFCDHIDFYNPLRRNGDAPNYSNPGAAYKTWRVFKQIFSQGCGGPTSIVPETSYFFDDTIHPDLYTKLGKNYVLVKPYKRDISFESVNECFEAALKSQGLDTNDEYYQYLKPLMLGEPLTLEGIRSYIQRANRGYRLKRFPFEDDTGAILERLEAAFPIPVAVAAASNVAPVASFNTGSIPFNVGSSGNAARPNVPFFGGKSRRYRRKRSTTKRNRKVRKGTRKN